MKTYRKAMTRDNGLILQETWSYAFEEGFEKTTGLKNPHNPSLVFHVINGATEIWEQDESFSWFKNSLLKINKEKPTFFEQQLSKYKNLMKVMEQYKIKKILNLNELKELIKYMRDASRLFVILYYTSYDERTPKKLREKALAWRKNDELYDIYEQVIKNSIANIAPRTQGMELVVTIEDLKDMPSKKVLQKRFQESLFIPGRAIETISINQFRSKHRDYRFIIEKPTKKELEGFLIGQIASPGIARGKVRILRKKSQVEELLKGEILVSPMTTPYFVPAMKKSSAIITDEGGVTSHAAIVAREIKKPCIIGTKFATKVLHDGDLIEVDANQGIIKILKKNFTKDN